MKHRKMFFRYGICLFNSNKKIYGGFNHFIAGKIFRWRYAYWLIEFRKVWEFEWMHNDDALFYDGYHNWISIGCLRIVYGT